MVWKTLKKCHKYVRKSWSPAEVTVRKSCSLMEVIVNCNIAVRKIHLW